MSKRVVAPMIDRAVGTVGLLLMLLVAKLAESGCVAPQTRPERVRAFLARRAMDGMAVIGWLVDTLSESSGLLASIWWRGRTRLRTLGTVGH